MTSPSAENLRAWLVSHLAALRGVDAQTIDARKRFSRYGLDSLGAARLIAELADHLGRVLSPTLVWELPTIDALAAHLTGAPEATRAAPAASRAIDVHEPIAVVGMSCRFPKSPDLASFWRLLEGGVDAITEVPRDRWDAAALFDPDPAAPGKLTTRWGGFLDQVDGFDPQFFGISPREAIEMDPQQRLMLELAWEALDDAGIPPPGLVESRTGVFVGALFTDYARLQDRAGAEAITTHTSTGGAACILANRISYALGLQGPSLTLDTACSSSLVAVHLACQSLRAGESDLALAGGVNLMLIPETTMGFSRLGAMSPDGRSRAFDARANGYVRSEGAGLLALKRLSDALRDGDPIHAVVRGSAVNNDGASNGLTAPSPRAQRAVLREACERASLTPGDIHYVEAHGTGTPLGDPIEAAGLGAVYGSVRAAGEPLLIGSAKSNVGHLEAAAGVVGLIKVALAMKHDLLPPSLHFETPNPHIDFEALGLEVVTRTRPWPAPEGALRRAGVSSFGYGGTNAHVILESAPRSLAERARPASAAEPATPRRAVWVFSGQGSQWDGMGRALVLAEPAFRAALTRCDAALRPHLGWSVFAEILAGAPRAVPERIDIVWPTLFAFQVALAALLRSLGAAPTAVIGHSIGEVTAAHVAGALSLDDAARVIACQARLVQRSVGLGSMLVAAVGWDDAQALAAASGGRITCAIAASPVMTVLAGDLAALADQRAALTVRGVFCRPVNTGAAVHGPQMAFLADELPGLLAGLSPARTGALMISTLTGEAVRGDELDAAYWTRQLREPVLFLQGTERLLAQGYDCFLEVSPHPIVKQSIEETARYRGASASVTAALSRGEDEATSLREALDALRVSSVRSTVAAPPQERAQLVPVSGRTVEAMIDAARNLADFVQDAASPTLSNLVYTTTVRRAHHGARAAVAARGRDALIDGLRALAEGREQPSRRAGAAGHGEPPGVVFVFSGQGSQWVGMGQRLLAEEPVFRAKVEACDACLRQHVSWSLLDELGAPEERSRLGETEVVQPALFAIQVGIAALLESWGVKPNAVLGHSVGEVAAAHVAGALSLEEAVRLVAWRGRIMQKATGRGKMAWVALSREDAAQAIAGRESALAIAAVNDPESAVLSGETAALEEVLAALAVRGVACRPLKVNYAFHSPQMDLLAGELVEALGVVDARRATVALYSTGTGAAIDGERLDAAYWGTNVRAPVEFAGAVASAFGDGQRLFFEIGPHPVLSTNLAQCLAAQKEPGHVAFTLRRESDEPVAMREALASLWALGVSVDWNALNPSGGRCVSLPSYPWQRERYWLEPTAAPKPPVVEPPDPLNDCVYELQWRKSKRAPAVDRASPIAGAWLIFGDRGGLGAALAARLAAHGDAAVRVVHGKGFARVEPDLYRIDPGSADDLASLLRDAFGKDRPCRGVVHLSSLDATPWDQATAETLEADQRIGFSSAVAVAQAILRQTWRDNPRLWLVTQGAQSVGSDRVTGVAQAPLWGLGRTIALEQPELECTLVDLDPARSIDQAGDLLGEITGPDSETQIALRDGARYVARLVRSRFDAAPPRDFRFESDATYLITGGLGGLGLSAAAWMVEQGARHLALVGRRAPTEEVQSTILALRAKGAEVLVVSADVSLQADAERVIAEIISRMPRLRGVLHAAGLVDDATLLTLSNDQFLRVLRPKMLGTFHLHALTREMPLQFFVLYSSITSLLGSAGQANYAAANAFMDALAHARVAGGRVATSIHWGPFTDVGMAANLESRGDRLSSRGIAGLTPDQGTSALQRFLRRPRAQVGFFHFAARHWLEFYPHMAAQPFLSELLKDAAAVPPRQSFSVALLAAMPAERPRLLEGHLRDQIARVLRLSPERIDRLAPFRSLGVDSLLTLEARNRLEASLGLKLAATLLFTYANIAVLAEYLLLQIAPPATLDRVEPLAPDPTESAADLDPDAVEDDLLAAFDASARLAKKELLS